MMKNPADPARAPDGFNVNDHWHRRCQNIGHHLPHGIQQAARRIHHHQHGSCVHIGGAINAALQIIGADRLNRVIQMDDDNGAALRPRRSREGRQRHSITKDAAIPPARRCRPAPCIPDRCSLCLVRADSSLVTFRCASTNRFSDNSPANHLSTAVTRLLLARFCTACCIAFTPAVCGSSCRAWATSRLRGAHLIRLQVQLRQHQVRRGIRLNLNGRVASWRAAAGFPSRSQTAAIPAWPGANAESAVRASRYSRSASSTRPRWKNASPSFTSAAAREAAAIEASRMAWICSSSKAACRTSVSL